MDAVGYTAWLLNPTASLTNANLENEKAGGNDATEQHGAPPTSNEDKLQREPIVRPPEMKMNTADEEKNNTGSAKGDLIEVVQSEPDQPQKMDADDDDDHPPLMFIVTDEEDGEEQDSNADGEPSAVVPQQATGEKQEVTRSEDPHKQLTPIREGSTPTATTNDLAQLPAKAQEEVLF